MRNKIKQLINRTPLIYRRFILICIDTLIIYNIINLSLFLSKNKNQVDAKIFFNNQVIGICVFFGIKDSFKYLTEIILLLNLSLFSCPTK